MLVSSAALDSLFWWLHESAPTWYAVLWPYSAAWAIGCAGAVVLYVSPQRTVTRYMSSRPMHHYSADIDYESKVILRNRWKLRGDDPCVTKCPRWWVAIPALAVHCWAGQYPNRWPHHWLQAQLHTVAFMFLLFGLALVATIRDSRTVRNVMLAVLFLGTAATYYPLPWNMGLKVHLMWFQSACYLALALSCRKLVR